MSDHRAPESGGTITRTASRDREGLLAAIAEDAALAALVLRERDGELVVLRGAPSAAIFEDGVEALRGQTVAEVLEPFGEGARHLAADLGEVQRTGVPLSTRLRWETAAGEHLATVAAARMALENGEDGVVVVFADRSREHQASAEREQIQARAEVVGQLEVVGRLAAGVAHDFNNVLTAIIGNTALLRMTLERAGGLTVRAEHIVEEIERASDRASALVRQLLTFTDQRPTAPDVYDVAELLTSASRIIERLLPESVAVQVEQLGTASIRIDRGLFEQAIVNLAVNASDAMPNGGQLTLRVTVIDAEAVVDVIDDGMGMTEAVRARVFDPFYTTKPPGKGTGLGLVNVRRTVEQAGGRVTATSRVGEGTTMTLRLPLCDDDAATAKRGSSPRDVIGGRERIFLCEDDHIVRQSVVGMLEQAGYLVQSATGPDEALTRLEQSVEAFDLIISDVIMPSMNGVEFARQVRMRLPDIPILFISGYSRDVLGEQGVREQDIDLLQKPFDYATLVQRVKHALGRRPVPNN